MGGRPAGTDEGLRVVDPPRPASATRRDWDEVCRFADAHPGKWVRVGVMDQTVRTHIRKGRYPKVDPALYEVMTSLEQDIQYESKNRSTLFIRRRV